MIDEETNGLHAMTLEVYSNDESIAKLEFFDGIFTVHLKQHILDGDDLRKIAQAVDYANEHMTKRLDHV